MNEVFIPTGHTAIHAPAERVEKGMETEPKEMEQPNEKNEVCYEHAGYQVRVHFSGSKTLLQCIKNLTERKIAG